MSLRDQARKRALEVEVAREAQRKFTQGRWDAFRRMVQGAWADLAELEGLPAFLEYPHPQVGRSMMERHEGPVLAVRLGRWDVPRTPGWGMPAVSAVVIDGPDETPMPEHGVDDVPKPPPPRLVEYGFRLLLERPGRDAFAFGQGFAAFLPNVRVGDGTDEEYTPVDQVWKVDYPGRRRRRMATTREMLEELAEVVGEHLLVVPPPMADEAGHRPGIDL